MAGLFGFTSYYPETNEKPVEEQLKAGQGCNVFKPDNDSVYYET